jgi:uncharacterized membrane protein
VSRFRAVAPGGPAFPSDDAGGRAPGSLLHSTAGVTSIAIWALVFVAAWLRFFHLSAQSLWVDEMLTIRAANIGSALGLREALSNIQGPLHIYIVHLLARLSTSEWLLRLPSALAGVAVVPTVYLLGRDLVGRRAGLIAASIATVSPFAIWYSQEVRNYALLMFLSAVSSLLAWRILTGMRRPWVSYVLGSAASLYCNLSAAFLVLGQTIFGVGYLKRNRALLARWLLACLVIVALFAPLAVIGVGGWVHEGDVGERVTLAPLADEEDLLRGATTFTPMAIPYSFFTMVYGYSLGPGLRELHVLDPVQAYARHLWLVVPAALAALCALGAGLAALRQRRLALLYVMSIVLTPLVAAGVLALLNIKPFNVRYVAVFFPVLMVTFGAGIASLRRTGALLWGIVILFCLVSARGYYFDPRYAREDVRDAARYVHEHEKPGDVVLVPVVPHVFGFYFEGEAERRVIYRWQTRTAENVAEGVRSVVSGHRRLWFVDSRLWFIDENRRLPAYLDASYRLLDRERFPGATLSLYELDGQSARQVDESGPDSP